MGDLDPVRELPYGLAALIIEPHQKPDRWQHPTRCQTNQKSLALWGASTDGKRTLWGSLGRKACRQTKTGLEPTHLGEALMPKRGVCHA